MLTDISPISSRLTNSNLTETVPLTEPRAVRIHDIQGSGLRSPLEGESVVNVPAIITAIVGLKQLKKVKRCIIVFA